MRKYYQTEEEAKADMQGHSFYKLMDIMLIMWQESDYLQDNSVFVLLRENEGLYWERCEEVR